MGDESTAGLFWTCNFCYFPCDGDAEPCRNIPARNQRACAEHKSVYEQDFPELYGLTTRLKRHLGDIPTLKESLKKPINKELTFRLSAHSHIRTNEHQLLTCGLRRLDKEPLLLTSLLQIRDVCEMLSFELKQTEKDYFAKKERLLKELEATTEDYCDDIEELMELCKKQDREAMERAVEAGFLVFEALRRAKQIVAEIEANSRG